MGDEKAGRIEPPTTSTLQPTAWTRPMQLTVFAWFAVQALWSLVIFYQYIGHPVTAIAVAVIAAVWVTAAIASYRGSQRMFRVAQYWFAFTALGVFINLRNLSADPSPIPRWELIVTEVMSIWGLGLWLWLTVGARRYGPWAMKRPGA